MKDQLKNKYNLFDCQFLLIEYIFLGYLETKENFYKNSRERDNVYISNIY
jgi:hypothetical protein